MFEECGCHNSSLWTEGPVDVELCAWNIIAVSVPLAVLALALPLHLLRIISQREIFLSSTSWSKLNLLRLTVTLVILVLNIVFSAMEPCPSLRTLLIILTVLTAVLKTTVLVSVVKSKVTTSKTILYFWMVNTAIYLPHIIREFNPGVHGNKYFGPALILALVLSAGMLGLQCLVYQPSEASQEGQERQTRGEDGQSHAAQLVFSWLDFLFKKGFKHEIPATDIPSLPKVLNVRKIIEKFENSFQAGAGGQGTRNLLLALFKSVGVKFMNGALLVAVKNIILFINPLIIQQLLNVIETDSDVSAGYFWCLLLVLSGLAASLITAQFHASIYQTGFQMRTAVMAAVFKKSLKLSAVSRQQYSVGEITNLIAIDAERFAEVIPYIHKVWSALFQICLALYLLYGIVGNSALAGMALLLTLVPANLLGNYFGKKAQTKQMELKDERIMKINEILQGIKVIKYYAWEKPFMSMVEKIRAAEVKTIKQYALVYSLMNVTYTVVPLLVTLATFTVYIYADPENHILTAEKVFSCIAIFNVLRTPLFLFPYSFMETVKLFVSVKRLGKFLQSSEIDTEYIGQGTSETLALQLEDGTFSWDEKEEEEEEEEEDSSTTLTNLNLTVEAGSLIAVVGEVGSGKSSLLAAITGEMSCKAGGLKSHCQSLAYVSQTAWIQNMTVKENIMFGRPHSSSHYQEVLEACALGPDLALLPAGDDTEIGEKGVNLSGGQKQRLALARAAYTEAQLYLLDDPLSAVDAHVAKHLFHKLIGPEGLLNKSTRIIVTHNLSFLSQMDRIILLKEGKIVLEGSYDEVKTDEKFQAYAQSTIITGTGEAEVPDDGKEMRAVSVVETSDGKLVDVEGRQAGRVSLVHYLHYFRLMNSVVCLLILSLYILAEAVMVLSNVVLAEWTDKAAVENLSLSEHSKYIIYYGGLNAVMFIISFVYNIWTFFRMTIPSIKMHQTVLERTMHAPLSFFESNPSGRVLNRFTSDIEVVDRKIPFQMGGVIYCSIYFLSVCVTVSVFVPFILVPLVPILAGFIFLHVVFTRARCQIKRHEAVAKSPILSHFSETISGAATVRAFREVERFQAEFEEKIEKHLRANYVSQMMNSWLSVRCDVLGNLLIFLISILTFYYRNSLSAGMTGLVITYAISVLEILAYTIRMICELETDSVAIERVREYERIEQEAAWETEEVGPDWPRTGEVVVEEVEARYRDNLPPCLQHLNLSLSSGEKLGVCGRTGAGKSSLASLLLRIIEPSQGSVKLAGVETTKVGLQQLRARLTIVPQDCVMFSGSVSFNLDPWESHSRDRLTEVLSLLGLSVELDTEITEGGGNLSMGERQLLCLGRAILRNSKLLILDEATSAMDVVTDQKMTSLVQSEFSSCTVVTIAHRLNTVLSCDRVCVMEKGKIIEIGDPRELMADTNTHFHGLAKSAGLS